MRSSKIRSVLCVATVPLLGAALQACGSSGDTGAPPPATTLDGSVSNDSGTLITPDSGSTHPDAGHPADAGVDAHANDAGQDGGAAIDSGVTDATVPSEGGSDAGGTTDGGSGTDATTPTDSGTTVDSGGVADSGSDSSTSDAGSTADAGADTGSTADAGTTADAGSDSGTGLTGPVVFTLVTGKAAVLDHWPSTDGLIGTADDVVGSTPSPINQSDPNSIASYSYNAFDFGSHATDTGMPATMNAMTFLQGTVTADATIGAAGGGSLITGWNISGTQPFSGHGAYSATITAVHSGSFNATTHALSMNFDITATLAGGTANGNNITMTGTGYVIQAGSYGTATGNSYVDNVVVPLAQSMSAQAVLFATGSGTVPASTGGSGGFFPSFPIRAVFVGVKQ